MPKKENKAGPTLTHITPGAFMGLFTVALFARLEWDQCLLALWPAFLLEMSKAGGRH